MAVQNSREDRRLLEIQLGGCLLVFTEAEFRSFLVEHRTLSESRRSCLGIEQESRRLHLGLCFGRTSCRHGGTGKTELSRPVTG